MLSPMTIVEQPSRIVIPSPTRIIGEIEGKLPGPTLIFVGGIHGNEPSGVIALQKVLEEINPLQNQLKGKFIALSGNIAALQQGLRYRDVDLNRQFTKDRMKALKTPLVGEASEIKEQRELFYAIEQILTTENGPFYFFDLHTTSGETIPFLTVNDSLLNRKFTQQYPLPIVLGIEEYLDGPLLSYINELGYVAFGFEGGQHNAQKSIQNHISFVMLSLVFTGCISPKLIGFKKYYQQLSQSVHKNFRFYEIIYRYEITAPYKFNMHPGYDNFQKIVKNENLASQNGKAIKAKKNGLIFMPLYQGKGNDGFFIIQKIPILFLWISKWVRNIQLDRLLVLFPGVQWKDSTRGELLVNRKIARYLTKEIFHLLGYRSKKWDRSHFVMKNRERSSRRSAYKKEAWY